MLLAPQVLAELSHTVGVQNQTPKSKPQDPESKTLKIQNHIQNPCGGASATKKKLSNAPLRATLGTLRAGSPFRVLPQPSLEGMSALSTPSASRTQPYGWGPKSNSKIQTPRSGIQNTKNPKSYPKPLWGCICHEKKLSNTPLRATLGTLRAGSPFRVLPQPSLEGMSALSTPSASRTQPYGWGPKSNSKIQTPRSRIQNTKNPKSYPKPLWANHTLKTKKTPHGRET